MVISTYFIQVNPIWVKTNEMQTALNSTYIFKKFNISILIFCYYLVFFIAAEPRGSAWEWEPVVQVVMNRHRKSHACPSEFLKSCTSQHLRTDLSLCPVSQYYTPLKEITNPYSLRISGLIQNENSSVVSAILDCFFKEEKSCTEATERSSCERWLLLSLFFFVQVEQKYLMFNSICYLQKHVDSWSSHHLTKIHGRNLSGYNKPIIFSVRCREELLDI